MKVYIVFSEGFYHEDSGIVKVFSSKEKAKEHILTVYKATATEDDTIYDARRNNFYCSYYICEFEVE